MTHEGHPQGAPNVTEFPTYQPRIQAVLVDLCEQFWQKEGETLAVQLLQLWDTGVAPMPVGVLWVLTERSFHCLLIYLP